MKRVLYLLLGVIVITQGCQTNSKLTDSDKDAMVQAVKQASTEYWAVWSSTYDTGTVGKIKKYMDLNTDQLWQTNPVSVIIDTTITYKQADALASIVSAVQNRISSPTIVKESHYSVLSDEKVLEVLEGDITVIWKDSTVMGPLKYVMSNIWTNIDGEWKIQFLHNSL
jgi:hypothetical protein